jgi:hypothetical protein
MDYYTAMEEAMIEAAEESLKPTNLTRDQMVSRIEEITECLKKSGVRSDERILLHAERQTYRLRLIRAEQVAQRLLRGSNGKNAQD